jgi:hypothetical protein
MCPYHLCAREGWCVYTESQVKRGNIINAHIALLEIRSLTSKTRIALNSALLRCSRPPHA